MDGGAGMACWLHHGAPLQPSFCSARAVSSRLQPFALELPPVSSTSSSSTCQSFCSNRSPRKDGVPDLWHGAGVTLLGLLIASGGRRRRNLLRRELHRKRAGCSAQSALPRRAAEAEVADPPLQEEEPSLADSRSGGEEVRQGAQKEEDQQHSAAATGSGEGFASRPTWREIGVAPPLEKALRGVMKLRTPNDLQVASMDPILQGHDAVLATYTGSGKTIAGLLPAVQRLMANMPLFTRGRLRGMHRVNVKEKCQPLLLVIAPSRGLCFQIRRVLEDLLSQQKSLCTVDEEKFMTFTPEEIVDNRVGVLFRNARPDIIVARPGEAWALQPHVDFEFLQCLMFDEVDKLLDEDSENIEKLLKILPVKQAQKILASASALAHPKIDSFFRIMKPDFRIIDSNFKCINAETVGLNGVQALSVPPTVIHSFIEVRRKDGEWASKRNEPEMALHNKLELLRRVVQRRGPGEFIVVFANHTKDNFKKLTKSLTKMSVDFQELNELFSKHFSKFTTHEEEQRPIILAKDGFATRGLDCGSVSVVINFDLPMSYKNYAHRSGRTGRAGCEGLVISFVSNQKEERFLRTTLSKLGSTLHRASVKGDWDTGYWVELDSPPEA